MSATRDAALAQALTPLANKVIHRLVPTEQLAYKRGNNPRTYGEIPSISHEIPKNGMESPSKPMPRMLSTDA